MQTIRDIATQRVLTSMTLLAGLTSFMIGNAYHAQMPGFAGDLGHGDPGVSYSVLLAADAAGALLAGIALEAWGRLKPNPRTAIVLAILWSLSLLAFASVGIYTLAIALLFAAGFFELSFNTMAQALVQINAPAEIRGRVVGLFNMAGLGMRAFSGITVGLPAPRSAFTGRSACRPPCCWLFCLSCIAALQRAARRRARCVPINRACATRCPIRADSAPNSASQRNDVKCQSGHERHVSNSEPYAFKHCLDKAP